MEEIIKIYRFDFSKREESSKTLNQLFVEFGYPNLCVTLQNDYDGLWGVINQRTNITITEMYHSGFVIFFKENNLIKVAFINDIDIDFKKSDAVIFCDKIKEKETE